MRLLPEALQNTEGLQFFKMLGTGAGQGFSIRPDWSVYALLTVWEKEESKGQWMQSQAWADLEKFSNGFVSFDLDAYHSKGTWNGQQPFNTEKKEPSPLMAVITRASIKAHKLPQFWLQVPKVSKVIAHQESLLFQKGMGEWPLIEQATFSVWDTEKAMRDFAYQQKEHAKVVRLTRELDWYKEEQFTRFFIRSVKGEWPNSLFANIFNHQSI